MGNQVTVRHPDGSSSYEQAPAWITRACQLRFEMSNAICVVDPEKPDTYRWNPENFWDGYTEVRVRPGDGTRGDLLEFTDCYSGETEVFAVTGEMISRTAREPRPIQPPVTPMVLEYVGGPSYRSPEPGSIGLYFHDGSDYVPGLDCGQYVVWYSTERLCYYDRQGMFGDWREVAEDSATPEMIATIRARRR